ncbi:PAS domain-containing protein [Paracoccus liaowanqingii]|uniref:PAS domain-containing protein n=1 Tax=Paracoccus liaowanqingii TaxID=2560053 RepID=A0A4Z1CQD0_9RHOB|nr:PAS domain-containing protein [Paracoccus liaowanqingii]
MAGRGRWCPCAGRWTASGPRIASRWPTIRISSHEDLNAFLILYCLCLPERPSRSGASVDIQGAALIVTAVLCGTLSVLLAVVAIRLWDRAGIRIGASRNAARALEGQVEPIVFLFRGTGLIDATPPARALLDRIGGPEDDWTRLMRWIGPRFPDAPDRLAQLSSRARVEILGHEGQGSATLRLLAEDLGDGIWRLTVTDPGADHAGIVVDSMSLQAMEEELHLLRGALDQTPMLVWRLDPDDRVTWANGAYLRRAEAQGDGAIGWPLPRLLDVPRPLPGTEPVARRAAVEDRGIASWYDCHSHRMGEHLMMFALPADAAVRAERSLREFVQTLTKTFADLPIGLAIFDQGRKLQLFNPALIDLTNLPTGFLTARPSLVDFLDQLREQRMVPEPKDYRSWRQHMANLESAAATGHHVETWSLPGGQTYRVTGRPHPDGAVAFLFENITTEISVTRRFRAELLLSAQVLDGLDDALAVFATTGQLVLSNQAYRSLWGPPPGGLSDAIAGWEAMTAASPGLATLRGALTLGDGLPAHAPSSGAMTGPQGQALGWTVTDLSGGRRMLRFWTGSGQSLTSDEAMPTLRCLPQTRSSD